MFPLQACKNKWLQMLKAGCALASSEQTWEISALMNEKQWRKLVTTVIGVKYIRYIYNYANQVWALYMR